MGCSTLHKPRHIPLHEDEHLPRQLGLSTVTVPSCATHVPLQSPWHSDSHLPMQFAGNSGVPSQNASALHSAWHCTLRSPGSQRVSMLPGVHCVLAAHPSSHCT